MQSVTLYYKPTCGYCLKVLRFIKDNGIMVQLTNVSQSPETRKEFADLTGNTQVPCLVHDGEILYESEDIIDWLAENGEKNDHT